MFESLKGFRVLGFRLERFKLMVWGCRVLAGVVKASGKFHEYMCMYIYMYMHIPVYRKCV